MTNEQSRLTQLAIKYNSDKYHFHSYIPNFYEGILAGRSVTRMLEIGIGYRDLMAPLVPEYTHGSSLYMWSEYFTDADGVPPGVFSCDIREDALINDDDKKIWSMKCDQSKPRELWDLIRWSGGYFDLIIDDGSHQPEHQLITASVLMPSLRPGGLYVVEDCWEDKAHELAAKLGGHVWVGNKRGDDCVVWVER